jgi:hypothetical protein
MRRIEAVAVEARRKCWRISLSLYLQPAWFLAAALALLASCKPNETKTLLAPSRALGAVLAEEAIHAAGANKKIAVISHDESRGPLSSVEQAFKAAVEKEGFSAFTAKSAYVGNLMGRGEVGLQPDDFFEAVQNAAAAGAIVSFAGAPLLGPDDAARVPASHPPILIVATARLGEQLGVTAKGERLASLLEAKIIQLAIIDGDSDSASPPSGKTDATHQLFARYYSILRPSP